MAKHLNMSIGFSADTSQAKAAINELSATLAQMGSGNFGNKTGQQTAQMTQQMERASEAAQQLSIHLSNAYNVKTGNIDLNRLNSSLKSANTSLSHLTTNLVQGGESGRMAFVQLANAISYADQPIIRVNGLLSEMWITMKNTARWQLTSGMLHGFISGAQKAVHYAKDLNTSLNNIRIVTGQSIEQMDKFADKANKAAKALSASTTAYTDASLIYYQQGLKGKDVQERTDTTVKMSNITRQSVEETSNQMTAIWNNFADGSKELEYYADVLAKLGAYTASSSKEISDGIQKFAGVAKTAGLSYEYAASALATITAKSRESADVVGTALKTLFARIQGLKLGDTLEDGVDLNKYSTALQKIGVSVLDVNGELRDADDILSDLGHKWKNLSDAQKTATAQTVAGVRQYNQLMTLMNNWDYMEELVGVSENATGTLQEQADIYAESWEAASKRLKASFQNVYTGIIDDDAIISGTNALGDMVSGVGDAIKELGGFGKIAQGIFGMIIVNSAKNVPAAIQTLKDNFTVLFGHVDKIYTRMNQEIQEVASGAIKSQTTFKDSQGNRVTKDVFSSSEKAQIQGASDLMKAKTRLALASNNLTDAEKRQAEMQLDNIRRQQEAYVSLMQNVEQLKKSYIDVKSEDLLNSDKINSFVQDDNGVQARRTALAKMIQDAPPDTAARDLHVFNLEKYDQQMTTFENRVRQFSSNVLESYRQTTTGIGKGMSSNQIFAPIKAQLQDLESSITKHTKVSRNQIRDLYNQFNMFSKMEPFSGLSNSKGLQELKTILSSKGKIDGTRVQQIFQQMSRDMLKMMNSAKLTEPAIKKLFEALGMSSNWEKASKSIKEYVADQNRAAEMAKKNASILNGYMPTHTVTGVEALSSAIGGLNSVVFAFSSLGSAWKNLTNPDVSGMQKATSLMMALTMSMTGAKSALKAFATAKAYFITVSEKALGIQKADVIAQSASLLAQKAENSADTYSMMLKLKENKLMSQGAITAITRAKARTANSNATLQEYAALALKNKELSEEVRLELEALAAGKFKTATATAGQGFMTFLGSAPGKIMLIVAALGILFAIIKAIYKYQQNFTTKAKFETDKAAVKDLANELEHARSRAEALKKEFDDYGKIVKRLDECTKGTREYADALLDADIAASGLITKYPELVEKGFVTEENGHRRINDEGLDYILDQQAKGEAILEASKIEAEQTAKESEIEFSAEQYNDSLDGYKNDELSRFQSQQMFNGQPLAHTTFNASALIPGEESVPVKFLDVYNESIKDGIYDEEKFRETAMKAMGYGAATNEEDAAAYLKEIGAIDENTKDTEADLIIQNWIDTQSRWANTALKEWTDQANQLGTQYNAINSNKSNQSLTTGIQDESKLNTALSVNDRSKMGEDASDTERQYAARVFNEVIDEAKNDVLSEAHLKKGAHGSDANAQAFLERYLDAIGVKDKDSYSLREKDAVTGVGEKQQIHVIVDGNEEDLYTKSMATAVAMAEKSTAAIDALLEAANVVGELENKNKKGSAQFLANGETSKTTSQEAQDWEDFKNSDANAGKSLEQKMADFMEIDLATLEEIANGFDQSLQEYVNNYNDQMNGIGESLVQSQDNLQETLDLLDHNNSINLTKVNEASSYAIDSINESLSQAFKTGGKEGLNQLIDMINSLPDEVNLDTIAEALAGIDWTQDGAADLFIQRLKDMGIILSDTTPVENYGSAMQDMGDKLPVERLQDFADILKDVFNLISGMKLGDILSDDDIAKLEAAGYALEDIAVQTTKGWQVTHLPDADDAKNAYIKTQNAYNEAYEGVQERNASDEFADNYLIGSDGSLMKGWSSNSSENNTLEESLAKMANGDVNADSSVANAILNGSLNGDMNIASMLFGSIGDADYLQALASGDIENEEDIRKMGELYMQFLADGAKGAFTDGATQAQIMASEDNILDLRNNEQFRDEDGNISEAGIGALESYATSGDRLNDEQVQSAYANYEANTKGLDEDKAEDLAKIRAEAEKLAKTLREIEVNKAGETVYNLIDTLKDLKGDKYAAAMNDIRDSLETAFGEKVTDEFIENHKDLISEWSKGSEEATAELKKIMAEEKSLADLSAMDTSGKLEEMEIKLTPLLGDTSGLDAEVQGLINQLSSNPVQLMMDMRSGNVDMTALYGALDALRAQGIDVSALLASIASTAFHVDASEISIPEFDDSMTLEGMADWIKGFVEGIGDIEFSTPGTAPADGTPNMQTYDNSGKGGGGGGGKKHTSASDVSKSLFDKKKQQLDARKGLLEAKADGADPSKAKEYIKEEIELIKEENKMLDKQIGIWEDLLKNKVKEFNAKYPEFNIELDDNGQIANYEEVLDKIMAEYVAMEKSGVSEDDLDKWWDVTNGDLEEIWGLSADILGAMQSKEENMAQAAQKMCDAICDEIDWAVEQIDYQIKRLNYYQWKLLNQAHGTKEKIEAMMKGLAYDEQEMLQLFEKGEVIRNGIDELNSAMGQFPGHEQPFKEAILGYQSDLIDLNKSIIELRNDIEGLVQEIMDMALAEIDTQIGRLDTYISMLDHVNNIIDLSGRSVMDVGLKAKISGMKIETMLGKMGALKDQLDGLKTAQAAAEEALEKRRADNDKSSVSFWQEQVNQIKQQVEIASEEFLASWEEVLTTAQELFEARVEATIAVFEDAMSPMGDLDFFQGSYEAHREEMERYLEDYEKVYELNKLNRDLEKNLNDNASLSAKQKLKEIQTEINRLQAEGVKMSQYDLEALQAKYEVKLAEIALEDAQNSKDQMRLVRDASGNWNYAYTSDETNVEDATQAYEDAVFNLQKLSKDYIKEMQDQILQNYTDFQEALAGLDKNSADYEAQMDALFNRHVEKDLFLQQELQKAIQATGQVYHDTFLGQEMDLYNWEDAHQKFVDNANSTVTDLKINYKDWQEVVEKAMNAAGTSWEDFSGDMDSSLGGLEGHIQALIKEIRNLVKVLTGYITETIGMVEAWEAKYSKRVDEELAKNEAYIDGNFGGGGGGGGGFDLSGDLSKKMTDYIANGGSASDAEYQAYYNARVDKMNADPSSYDKWASTEQVHNVLGNASLGHSSSVGLATDVHKSEPGQAPGGGYTVNNYNKVTNNTYIQQTEGGPSSFETFDTGGYTGDWQTQKGKMAMLHEKELILNKDDTENILEAVKATRTRQIDPYFGRGEANIPTSSINVDWSQKMAEYIQNGGKAIDEEYRKMMIQRELKLANLNHSGMFDWGKSVLYDIEKYAKQFMGGLSDFFGKNEDTSYKRYLENDFGKTIEQTVHIDADFPNVTDHFEIEEALTNLVNDAAQYVNSYR